MGKYLVLGLFYTYLKGRVCVFAHPRSKRVCVFTHTPSKRVCTFEKIDIHKIHLKKRDIVYLKIHEIKLFKKDHEYLKQKRFSAFALSATSCLFLRNKLITNLESNRSRQTTLSLSEMENL